MSGRLRLAIFISGRGSNMVRLVEACQAGHIPAEPVLIVSNRPDAAGLTHAREAGLDTLALDHKAFDGDRRAFEAGIQSALMAAGIELIALAGFMRVLTPWFVGKWAGRMINIHPSLLPKYPGLLTHARALEAGDTVTGCSVHYVTEGVDEGEIIAQARVPVRPGDTPERLAARVMTAEHALYPAALRIACMRLLEGWDDLVETPPS